MSSHALENQFLKLTIDNPKKSSSGDGDQITLNFNGSGNDVKIPVETKFGPQKIKFALSCAGNINLTQLPKEDEWSVSGLINIHAESKNQLFKQTESESGKISNTNKVSITNAKEVKAVDLLLDVFKNIQQSPISFTSDGTKLELTSKSSHKSFINKKGELILAVFIEQVKSTN